MVLRRLKGGLRRLIGADKTRGKMYARLCALGIRAQLAEQGRPEANSDPERYEGAVLAFLEHRPAMIEPNRNQVMRKRHEQSLA